MPLPAPAATLTTIAALSRIFLPVRLAMTITVTMAIPAMTVLRLGMSGHC